METKQTIIHTRELKRYFKKTHAVDGINLDIKAGELFGLVGPDGAGKTTTIRLLAGLLDITDGEAQVAGIDIKAHPEAVKSHIGYMAQQFSLYGELSVTENLAFFSEIYDVPPEVRAERTEQLLSFAGLTSFKSRRADKLSGGMQKKLALACTLIHQPEILLLDEPTTGVDPIARREFWRILTDLHLNGTTIIVSTPYMDEADRCSRVGLMYAGKLIECAPPQKIREQLGSEVIELQSEHWRAAQEIVASLDGVREVQTYGESLHILVDSAKKRIKRIEKTMKTHGLTYTDIRIVSPRMEEAFISMIRKLEQGN